MKLLLATIHLEESTRAVPLAAACLKAAAPNHELELRDFTVEQRALEIAKDLASDEKCASIGFPVYLWNRSLVIEVISLLSDLRPDIFLIAGGPEVTAAPLAFLDDSDVDLLMQGEGEELINPVLDALSSAQPLPRLPGLSTADFHSPQSAFCKDINALESPILSGALDLSRNRGLLWELSRGCPFACDFCFESKGSGGVRVFELERIRDELAAIRDAGIEQVFVLDPTFNVNKKRVLTILEWIGKMTPDTYYYFEVRTEFLDEETAEAFASIPCTLQIGLQSSSIEVLNLINRKFDPLAFQNKTELLGQAGVSFGVDLIYGLPGDSLSGFRESMDYAISLEPNHIDLFPLAVLPGTTLFDRQEQLHIKADSSDPYIVRETKDFSSDDLKAAAVLSSACDSLYNQNRGISWFSRVCYDLSLRPADLVEQWAVWTGGEDGSPAERKLKKFLEAVYVSAGKSYLLPVIEDLLDYLDLMEDIEKAESSSIPSDQIILEDDSLLSLHSSCRIETFHLHPSVLASGLPASSEELMTEAGSYKTLFWLRDFELCADLLSEDEENLLSAIGTKIKYGDIRESFNDMDDFIISGILEAYLIIE